MRQAGFTFVEIMVVVAVLLLLAADESRFINGAVIAADDGMNAQ